MGAMAPVALPEGESAWLDELKERRDCPSGGEEGVGASYGKVEAGVAGEPLAPFEVDDERESIEEPELLLCRPIANEGRGGINMDDPASE